MSAIDLLPGNVVDDIRAKSKRIREDLLAIPAAEAKGWKVTFRNDHWHNAATFEKNNKTIWSTGRDWRAASLSRGRFGVPRVYASVGEALKAEEPVQR